MDGVNITSHEIHWILRISLRCLATRSTVVRLLVSVTRIEGAAVGLWQHAARLGSIEHLLEIDCRVKGLSRVLDVTNSTCTTLIRLLHGLLVDS